MAAPQLAIHATSHAIHVYGHQDPTNTNNETLDFTASEILAKPRQMSILKGKMFHLPAPPVAKRNEKSPQPNYVVNFWPVRPATQYMITVTITTTTKTAKTENSQPSSQNDDDAAVAITNPSKSTKTFQLKTSTRASPFKKDELILVTSDEIAENPGIMELILSEKLTQEYLIMVERDIHTNLIFLEKLFWNALFILPDNESVVSSLPNAKNRFSIDLQQQNIPWLESRKVKKYMKNFELCLTNNFSEILSVAQEIHEELKGGTWIVPSFTETLQKLAKKNDDPNSLIQLYAFVLKEKPKQKKEKKEDKKNTNEDAAVAAAASTSEAKEGPGIDETKPRIAAATFGFACGRNFHDYTMTTVIRDHRSAGILVTKLAGYILQQAGFQFWYWGMRIGYMEEFAGEYGGADFERTAFYNKWNQFREEKLDKPLGAAAVEICKGINLDFKYETVS